MRSRAGEGRKTRARITRTSVVNASREQPSRGWASDHAHPLARPVRHTRACRRRTPNRSAVGAPGAALRRRRCLGPRRAHPALRSAARRVASRASRTHRGPARLRSAPVSLACGPRAAPHPARIGPTDRPHARSGAKPSASPDEAPAGHDDRRHDQPPGVGDWPRSVRPRARGTCRSRAHRGARRAADDDRRRASRGSRPPAVWSGSGSPAIRVRMRSIKTSRSRTSPSSPPNQPSSVRSPSTGERYGSRVLRSERSRRVATRASWTGSASALARIFGSSSISRITLLASAYPTSVSKRERGRSRGTLTSGSGWPPSAVSSFEAVVGFAPARVNRSERSLRSRPAPEPFTSSSIWRKEGPGVPSIDEETRSSLTSTAPIRHFSRSVSIAAIGSNGAPRTIPRTSAGQSGWRCVRRPRLVQLLTVEDHPGRGDARRRADLEGPTVLRPVGGVPVAERLAPAEQATVGGVPVVGAQLDGRPPGRLTEEGQFEVVRDLELRLPLPGTMGHVTKPGIRGTSSLSAPPPTCRMAGCLAG